MRRAVPAALVLALAGLTAAADADRKFVAKDGSYSIAFPTGAEVKTQEQDEGTGVKLNIAMVDARDKAYAVMHLVLPESAKGIPARTLLDAGQSGAIQKSGGKLLKSEEITFGKERHPGRDLLVEKDGSKLRAKVIVAPPRVFIVLVGGPKDYATSDEASKFLDSFGIAK
jgi:hypothetical protein